MWLNGFVQTRSLPEKSRYFQPDERKAEARQLPPGLASGVLEPATRASQNSSPWVSNDV